MTFSIGDMATAEIKEALDVLGPDETRRQRLWDECVSEAKVLVATYKDIRWQIVALAEKCCVMHYGGRTSSNRYTVAAFAKEIGITDSTLYEWIRLKRIKESIGDLPNVDEFTYEDLKILDRETASENGDQSKKRESIRKAAERHLQRNPDTIRLIKYVKYLKTIRFNAKNPRMIKDCDPEVLGEIVHLCREIVRLMAPLDKKEKMR